MDGWFSSRGTEITGKVKYVRVSKSTYNLLKQSNGYYSNQFANDKILNVGVYGDEWSNTDVVAKEYFDNNKTNRELVYIYFDSIDNMYQYYQAKKLDIVFVPENNRNKKINTHTIFEDNVPNKYKLEKQRKEIKYVLGSIKSHFQLNDETIFISHEQALQQCSQYINNRCVVKSTSSSHAARELKYFMNSNNAVAICNNKARKYYNLFLVKNNDGSIIDPYIKTNTKSFVSNAQTKNITIFGIYISELYYSQLNPTVT